MTLKDAYNTNLKGTFSCEEIKNIKFDFDPYQKVLESLEWRSLK